MAAHFERRVAAPGAEAPPTGSGAGTDARRAPAPLLVAAGAAAGAGVALLDGGTAAVLATAVLGGALALAGSRPQAAWLIALGALLAVAPIEALPLAAYALVAAHTFCAARWAGKRAGILRSLALVGALELGVHLADGTGAVPAVLIPAAGWAAGRALAEREDLAERLALRARDLEAEREAHAELSVRYERAQIAAELHDIVAHALSVMVVQAGAGQRLVQRDPAGAAGSLEAIATAAREAEQDLARLVALLADTEPSAAAPDLALVERLVGHAAAAGAAVRLRVEGPTTEVGRPVAELGYRVVQEGLTNALRHAPGAAVDVLVHADPDARALAIEVANGPGGPRSAAPAVIGTGNGLRGLRERVGARGGMLSGAPTPDGGWLLRARIQGPSEKNWRGRDRRGSSRAPHESRRE